MTILNNKILLFICIVSLFATTSAFAEEKSAQSSSNDILSPSEYAQCQKRAMTLEQKAAQLKEQYSEVEAMKKKMSNLEHERSEEYTDINFQSQGSVNEYNQVNDQLNQLAQDYTNRAKSLNSDVKQYQMDVSRLKTECEHKKYRE